MGKDRVRGNGGEWGQRPGFLTAVKEAWRQRVKCAPPPPQMFPVFEILQVSETLWPPARRALSGERLWAVRVASQPLLWDHLEVPSRALAAAAQCAPGGGRCGRLAPSPSSRPPLQPSR